MDGRTNPQHTIVAALAKAANGAQEKDFVWLT